MDRPARSSVSRAPANLTSPPLTGITPQSMRERSNAFCDVYAVTSKYFPSGDQIGLRAAVNPVPMRCGAPPASDTIQIEPVPGIAESTPGSPTQYATSEPSGEYLGFKPSLAISRASPPNAGIS